MNAKNTSAIVLMLMLGLGVLSTQGCYVNCPASSHCQAYYDMRTGCSTCVCSKKLVKEVCPNKRIICPRNCPLRSDHQYPGCYSCACMMPGLPFKFMGL